jgi:hypothetical protein
MGKETAGRVGRTGGGAKVQIPPLRFDGTKSRTCAFRLYPLAYSPLAADSAFLYGGEYLLEKQYLRLTCDGI